MKVTGTAYVPELNRTLYVAVLSVHTVLLNEEQQAIVKDCSSCGNMYTMDEFYRDKYAIFNRTFTCKHCRADIGRQFREHNPLYYRQYLINNRERTIAKRQEWQSQNQDKVAVYSAKNSFKRQLALQRAFPDDPGYIKQLEQNKVCAITGTTVDVELDHILPLAEGRWGNTRGNLMWLSSKLNNSKSNRNIFEWSESLEQERLDYLLPEGIEMTVQDFQDKVLAVLTEKAAEKGLTLAEYKQEYEKEYYREEQ